MPDGTYNSGRRIDWEDWSRWLGPQSELKQLADAHLPLVDIIPEQADAWAFGRDYDAFFQLAGVRGGYGDEKGPLIEPRGVPDDISELLFVECFMEEWKSRWGTCPRTAKRDEKTWYWHPDWHTPHWYSLGDLRRQAVGKSVKKRIRQLREEMKKIAKTYKLGNEDVRVVFWFDN